MSCGGRFVPEETRYAVRRARAFYSVWSRLANVSQCDAMDSMECLRVYAEWVEAGRPTHVAEFIRESANRAA